MFTRRQFSLATAQTIAVGLTPRSRSLAQSEKAQKRRLKIGQIGVCHEHAAPRMESLLKLGDEFEVVGVVDDRSSKAARFAGTQLKAFEGLRWLTEKELFEISDLDAVIIETANEDLVPTALRVLDRGIAISMDKPGGFDFDNFFYLRTEMEKRKLPFQMGYMFRTNPGILWIQEAVKKGWLGEIFEIEASMSHNYGSDRYREYLSKLPGGIMFNLGCHHIDWITTILGRPKAVHPVLGSTKDAKIETINNARVTLEYDHAIVTIQAVDIEPMGLARRRLKISGTKGSFEMLPIERFDGESLAGELILKTAAGPYQAGKHRVALGQLKDRYIDQHIEFANWLRDKNPSMYDAKHDVLVHEIHLASSGIADWKA